MHNWNYEIMAKSSNFIWDQRGRRWFISYKSLTLVLNNLKVKEMLFNKQLWVYCRPRVRLVPSVIALTMMYPPSNYMLRFFKHCWTIGLPSNIKWMSIDDNGNLKGNGFKKILLFSFFYPVQRCLSVITRTESQGQALGPWTSIFSTKRHIQTACLPTSISSASDMSSRM